MYPSRRLRGFTLIEVVVALAIVALGMFAVFKAIGDTTSNIGYLRDRSMAAWIADNRITEIRLSGEFPSVDRTEGDVDFAGRRWHWAATVSQTPVEGLRRIDIKVRREDDAEDSALSSLAGFVGATAISSGPSSTPWNSGVPGGNPGDEEEP
ncbi:MAG: type II secretion system protein GspI [Gammaproteobacteria bacterium]|nr:type II secretion system protein GspI [Gammaproteobacteria bacterium]